MKGGEKTGSVKSSMTSHAIKTRRDTRVDTNAVSKSSAYIYNTST